MAFEDDMIEAGYSDEQDYFDSLIDDFEESYRRQQDCELEYDDDYDSYDYEEEERKRLERQLRREAEKQWVNNWKVENPNLAIIWQAYNRHYMGLNEHNRLKKWLNERERFESERQKADWLANLQGLFSMYKNELFKFYFSVDEERIDMSLISQQARELSSIVLYEPSLWETVRPCYSVDAKLFEEIEWAAFWSEVYRRDMDYEYWKDKYVDKYNEIAEQWIASDAIHVYGGWVKKHEEEEIEWKNKNCNLLNLFKHNYEIREKNKYIESIIDEFENENIFEEDDFSDEDLSIFAGSDLNYDEVIEHKPLLPDLDCSVESPYDLCSLDKELCQRIQESLNSFDMSNISIESSKYADKAMSQLWIYSNRDEWEMDALKEHHKDLFKYEYKFSQELLNWWKEKYPDERDNFVKTIVPLFKNKLEVVMKFRLWALDGNKEAFISIADKYLTYWNKALMLMYGQDIYEQLKSYFYPEIGYFADFWGEDVDYIKKVASTNQEVEMWQKELRDKVIWDIVYNRNYKEHYFIKHMYTSLMEFGDIR